MKRDVSVVNHAAQLQLYPYNSCDWLGVDEGGFTDASCRPDPDLTAMTLGLCRPRFRRAIHKRFQAGEFSGGLDFAFFTRGRSGPDFAFVAWLRLASVYATHPIAAATRLDGCLNLMTIGSRCLCGVVYRGRTLPASTPCGCALYVDRVETPYLVFEAPAANAVRTETPSRLSFARLQSLLPAYFTSVGAHSAS